VLVATPILAGVFGALDDLPSADMLAGRTDYLLSTPLNPILVRPDIAMSAEPAASTG
jgi:hypothetical protein